MSIEDDSFGTLMDPPVTRFEPDGGKFGSLIGFRGGSILDMMFDGDAPRCDPHSDTSTLRNIRLYVSQDEFEQDHPFLTLKNDKTAAGDRLNSYLVDKRMRALGLREAHHVVL